MRSTRRRSDRPASAQARPGSSLEVLETRQLLTAESGISFYMPTDLPPRTVVPVPAPITTYHPLSASPRQLSFLDNDGKVLTGKDRQGDEWTITVHGPGVAIVTDTSPADGIFDDAIDTIQLIGTDINNTYVTGQVVASARLQTPGVVTFNHLVAPNGVASIILNGFTLAQTPPPPTGLPVGVNPSIFLPGGVRTLQFHDIQALTDIAAGFNPVQIIIGEPTSPLTIQPTIHIDSIFNTVFDSAGITDPFLPTVRPTVQILVNGQLHGLDIVSAGPETVPAALQSQFPMTGLTGRTAVQALGVNDLNVVGSARNFTVSRRQPPFSSGFSGVDHINSATFGGVADAVGLDAAGPIGRLRFRHGLGDPTGTSISAANFGTPLANFGYPGAGFLGGLVTATNIGSIEAGPANIKLQTANDPDYIQLYRTGHAAYYPRAGNALTNSAIVTTGSIGNVTLVGDAQASEIKTGFHYGSFVAGLEPTRAPSRIGRVTHRGNLVDAAISATYRPVDFIYGNGNDLAGRGSIRGSTNGVLVATGQTTPLSNAGAGFFARKKRGYLPPPSAPTRVDFVSVRP